MIISLHFSQIICNILNNSVSIRSRTCCNKCCHAQVSRQYRHCQCQGVILWIGMRQLCQCGNVLAMLRRVASGQSLPPVVWGSPHRFQSSRVHYDWQWQSVTRVLVHHHQCQLQSGHNLPPTTIPTVQWPLKLSDYWLSARLRWSIEIPWLSRISSANHESLDPFICFW